jgi:hypothetical protein
MNVMRKKSDRLEERWLLSLHCLFVGQPSCMQLNAEYFLEKHFVCNSKLRTALDC